jgi:hypothetical protein
MNTVKSSEKYYVALRSQTNEVHSVHRDGCPFMPGNNKRIFLGNFTNGSDAGIAGRKYFQNSCGCRFCITDKSKAMDPVNNESFKFLPTDKQIEGVGLRYLLN